MTERESIQHYEQASADFLTDRYDDALDELDAILADDPEDQPAKLLRNKVIAAMTA